MKRKAKIKFMPSKTKSARGPGYGPQLRVGDIYTSCIITPQNTEIEVMNFETEYDVFIELRFEDMYGDKVDLMNNIELYEGPKLVGIGNFTRE